MQSTHVVDDAQVHSLVDKVLHDLQVAVLHSTQESVPAVLQEGTSAGSDTSQENMHIMHFNQERRVQFSQNVRFESHLVNDLQRDCTLLHEPLDDGQLALKARQHQCGCIPLKESGYHTQTHR